MKKMHRPIAVLVTASLLGGIVALIVSVRAPVKYQASISFAVNRINASPSDNYQYDGYYAIQAADLFSQTVVSWFSTPSVLREVYDRAGVAITNNQIAKVTGRFKTKKYAAQNIVVTFNEATAAGASKVATAVADTMHDRAASLNQTSDRAALFEIVGSTPVVTQVVADPLLNTVIGLAAGFLLALAALSVANYVRTLDAESLTHARRD